LDELDHPAPGARGTSIGAPGRRRGEDVGMTSGSTTPPTTDGATDVESQAGSPDARPVALPPDPQAYDAERNVHARARGLAAPYIAGGRDPEPEVGRSEERFYGRLLLAMVGLIVLGGFALGIISSLLGLTGLVGN